MPSYMRTMRRRIPRESRELVISHRARGRRSIFTLPTFARRFLDSRPGRSEATRAAKIARREREKAGR